MKEERWHTNSRRGKKWTGGKREQQRMEEERPFSVYRVASTTELIFCFRVLLDVDCQGTDTVLRPTRMDGSFVLRSRNSSRHKKA